MCAQSSGNVGSMTPSPSLTRAKPNESPLPPKLKSPWNSETSTPWRPPLLDEPHFTRSDSDEPRAPSPTPAPQPSAMKETADHERGGESLGEKGSHDRASQRSSCHSIEIDEFVEESAKSVCDNLTQLATHSRVHPRDVSRAGRDGLRDLRGMWEIVARPDRNEVGDVDEARQATRCPPRRWEAPATRRRGAASAPTLPDYG